MNSRSLFTVLVGLLALGSVALASPPQEFDQNPGRKFTVKPWRASLDQVDWREPRYSWSRPNHHFWNPEELEAIKREMLILPEIQPGRELAEGEAEAAIEDLGGITAPKAPKRTGAFEGANQDEAGFGEFVFFPPDTHIGASRNKVLEVTNVAARLSNRNGSNEQIRSLYNFFAIDPSLDVFDPRVFFDRLSGRFFLVVVAVGRNPNRSRIYLAVSRSGDPQSLTAPGAFCTYRIKGKRTNSYADYPSIGVNENWFVISVNNFKFNGAGLKAVYLYATKVSRITNNAGGCPALRVSRFKVRNDPEGVPVFTLQPAMHYTPNGLANKPLFLMSSQPFFFGNRYMLARLKTRADGSASLAKQMLTGSTYSVPPPAPQRQGEDVDSGDMRVMQVAFRSGKLWSVMATGCSIGTGNNESCVRAIQVTPTDNSATITFEETFGKSNWFFYWPSIAINKRGDVVVAFQRSKSDRYLGTAFNGKRASRNSFDSKVKNLRNGRCAIDQKDDRDKIRTGDYTGAQTDPKDDLSFFIAGEYTDIVAGGRCAWHTRVGRVRY